MQLDRQTGATDLVQQRVETVEAGLGGELDLVSVAAHSGEEASDLGKRCASGPLNASKGLAILRQRIRELVLTAPTRRTITPDGVGDDVEELTGDARALLRNSDACGRLAVVLSLGRTFLPPLRPARSALGERSPRPSRGNEPEGDEDEAADGQYTKVL